MPDRCFTPAEVEALVPTLARVMERAMRAHGEAETARRRLEAEHRRIALVGGAVIDHDAWRADRDLVHERAAEVRAAVAEIEALGGAVKDLTLGLVDFPHRRGRRIVNLCWRYGEEAIRYWHGRDEGYAARKPL